MQEKNAFGTVQAEIINISRYPSINTDASYYYHNNITTKITLAEIKLLAVYNKSKQLYTYKGNPVNVGNNLTLEFDRQTVQGFVVALRDTEKPEEKTYRLIKTKLIEYQSVFRETTGVESFVADAIPDHEIIMDADNKPLVEIIEKRVIPARRYTQNDRGEIFIQDDPMRKDVYLTLKVQTERIHNEDYFFNTYRIAVNQVIPIALNHIFIEPTITEIVE